MINPRYAAVSAAVMLTLATHAHADADRLVVKTPFSAVRVSSNKFFPDEKSKSRIMLSADGLREEMINTRVRGGVQYIVIREFRTDQTWFIVPDERKYSTPEEEEVVTAEEVDEVPGLFSPKPCDGYRTAVKMGDERHYSRSTVRWVCDGGRAVQLFDPALGIVVRHEDKQGLVEELHDIKPGKQPRALFAPPADYRKVPMMELLTGMVQLPPFEESPNDP